MKSFFLISLLFIIHAVSAQPVNQKPANSYAKFISDSQLTHAIASLYVINASSGKVVFEKNANAGLAPASTQKVITSVTAYEILGKEHLFKTTIGYTGTLANGELNGDIIITGGGDPTFGSWRWESTNEKTVITKITDAIIAKGIRKINGRILVSIDNFEKHQMPDGWIWQDAGNYYGAGPSALNWRENQYDLFLKSGKNIGDPVSVVRTLPQLYCYTFGSSASSAAAGTGDNAYIYLPVGDNRIEVKGTIPVNENSFRISGAMPDPVRQFCITLSEALNEKKVSNTFNCQDNFLSEPGRQTTMISTMNSPVLDSVIYWFNRRSINLYGESLVQAIGRSVSARGNTVEGIKSLQAFWKKNGLGEHELNMYDGSGLSPLNRVTTKAQVMILAYAKNKPWFSGFYEALPEYNNMKMKSGTISDVKGFCGYHRSKDGKEYIFSFLVNNYNGRASALVNKMYKVLDELKWRG